MPDWLTNWLATLTPEGYLFVVLLVGSVFALVVACVDAWLDGWWN